jgi:hypothetical protein
VGESGFNVFQVQPKDLHTASSHRQYVPSSWEGNSRKFASGREAANLSGTSTILWKREEAFGRILYRHVELLHRVLVRRARTEVLRTVIFLQGIPGEFSATRALTTEMSQPGHLNG